MRRDAVPSLAHTAGAAALAAACLAPAGAGAADLDPSKLPPAASRPVTFSADIQPIFEKTCFQCHGPEKPKSRFRLDNRADALKGGANGVDIIPGDSAASPLIYYVARVSEDEDFHM